MKILQANCRKTLVACQAILEGALEIKAEIVCIQEPFLGRDFRLFTHNAFQIYWPEVETEKRNQTRVAIAIRKDVLNTFIWEERSDLIQHTHVQAIDIWELTEEGTKKRRTRVINIYDQNTQDEQGRTTRPIRQVQWEKILKGRSILLGDFNAKSFHWDPRGKPTNAKDLENLIEKFNLFLNNDTSEYTREEGKSKSVLDLTFSTLALGPLDSWSIVDEIQTPSDHKPIASELQLLSREGSPTSTSNTVTGWKIDELSDEQKEEMSREWDTRALLFPQQLSSKSEIEREAVWIQETAVQILNKHAKQIRITPRSKRWWNETVKQARKGFLRCRRHYENGRTNWEELKTIRNAYYSTIRREKRLAWQRFLQGETENHEVDGNNTSQAQKTDEANKRNELQGDENRCWIALRYQKPKTPSTTPSIEIKENGIRRQAATIEEKEKIFLEQAFPRQNQEKENAQNGIQWREANIEQAPATDEEIETALFTQSVKKAPGISGLNFKALRLMWRWDRERIVKLIQACIQKGIQPSVWKTAKGILLRKPNKPNYSIPKAYRVISLLECLGKVVEKVVATKISNFCEAKKTLHEGQFGCRKNRSTHDALLQLMAFVEKAWREKQIAGAIFMDVKGAFDGVNQKKLVQILIGIGLSQNLVRWVASFLQGRRAQLIIDGHECPLRDISAGLPQGSPVSPILFIVYIHALLKRMEEEHPQNQNLSFVDDIGILAKGHSIEEVSQQLEKAGISLVQKGKEHKINFDEDKTEAIIFTRKRKLNREIQQAKLQLPNFTCSYNENATRWLGFWLDSKLSFREHFNIRYQKAEKVLQALKALSKRNGLPMSLLHKVQVAAVHSVALYGSEIWWEGQKDKQEKIQKLLNKQARAITGAFKTTPIPFLKKEANLPDATGLLDNRRLGFTLRCLKQVEGHPSRRILPPSLRFGEIGELGQLFSETNLEWATKPKGGDIGKRLARILNRKIPITLENGIDYHHEWPKPDDSEFPGKIKVFDDKQAIQVANRNENTAIFTDGSRMGQKDREKAGAAMAQKDERGWKTRGWHLGYGKTALDAELFALSQALKTVLAQSQNQQVSHVFTDSQSALELIEKGKNLPSIVRTIWRDAEKLKARGTPIKLLWVPGHEGVNGNEEADRAARKAAQGGKNADPTVTTFYLEEQVTKQKRKQKNPFIPALKGMKKILTSRFLQLKSGHAAVGSYQKRFKLSSSAKCHWCGNDNEDRTHALLRCKEWGKQRKKLRENLRRKEIFLSPRLNGIDTQVLFQEKAAEATLEFLSETQIGNLQKKEDGEWLDTWDLQLLDPGGEEEVHPNSSPLCEPPPNGETLINTPHISP